MAPVARLVEVGGNGKQGGRREEGKRVFCALQIKYLCYSAR